MFPIAPGISLSCRAGRKGGPKTVLETVKGPSLFSCPAAAARAADARGTAAGFPPMAFRFHTDIYFFTFAFSIRRKPVLNVKTTLSVYHVKISNSFLGKDISTFLTVC